MTQQKNIEPVLKEEAQAKPKEEAIETAPKEIETAPKEEVQAKPKEEAIETAPKEEKIENQKRKL